MVTYLQLVENKRKAGPASGCCAPSRRADDPKLAADVGRLLSTARRYAKEQALVVDESTRGETKTWGPHLVWGRLWQETLGPLVEETLFPERLARAVYLMVLGRLSAPSKCATYVWAEDVRSGGSRLVS